MHSQDFAYTDLDLLYTANHLEYDERFPRRNPLNVTFTYNSDLSGEVCISLVTPGNKLEPNIKIMDVYVPGWMLLEFVGRYIKSEKISKLEELTGRETLGV